MSLKESSTEKHLCPEEQQAKDRNSGKKIGRTKMIDGLYYIADLEFLQINEVRKMIGSIADKLPDLCSDPSISRYLRARNWNTVKAGKMLKQTLKWRLEYRPEKIQWEDIAHEAETGKIYRANYFDKYGRVVLIMRPGFQNTNAVSGQIRYLVYCMENAIMNLNPDQEQMIWLVDFQKWNSSSISLKSTRETAHILQNHYPERLGFGILYNPPKIFESFWKMVKPFIEPKTFKKVKFVYSNNPQSQKIMEELFDMDKLECTFGGRNSLGFEYEAYAQRMKEDDNRMSHLITSGCSSPSNQLSIMSESLACDRGSGGNHSVHSDEGGFSSGNEITSSDLDLVDDKIPDQPHDVKDVVNSNTEAAKEMQISNPN